VDWPAAPRALAVAETGHAALSAQLERARSPAAQAAGGSHLAPARHRGELRDGPRVPQPAGEDQLAHSEVEGEGLGIRCRDVDPKLFPVKFCV
jgi:hypothetical protein